MFYHLLYPLHDRDRGVQRLPLHHVPHRDGDADGAPAVSLLLGPGLIAACGTSQIGQEIREEGPSSHQTKRGTPTMGGLLIILAAVVLPTLLWADLRNVFVWIAVTATVLFGAIGFADDYVKVVAAAEPRLDARGAKFALAGRGRARPRPSCCAAGARRACSRTTLSVPFFKTFRPDLGWRLPAVRRARARRLVQRREPDRRAGRAGHRLAPHRLGARSAILTLRRRPRDRRRLPRDRQRQGRRRADGLLRRGGRREPRASSGSTATPPRSSWATSARWRWAERSARSRC